MRRDDRNLGELAEPLDVIPEPVPIDVAEEPLALRAALHARDQARPKLPRDP
jgi:hypothetical protein